jgi:hypothetical protein
VTYYEELGVSETASREEIRRAYQHLSDRERQQLTGKVEVLLDTESRERYDRSLMSLAATMVGLPAVGARPGSLWRRLAPAGITVAAAVLILVLGSSPVRAPIASPFPLRTSPPVPAIPTLAPDQDWEPLSESTYESHVPTP